MRILASAIKFWRKKSFAAENLDNTLRLAYNPFRS